MSTTSAPRVTRTPPALRALEYWIYQYRRMWRGSVISGFISPLLYLAAMGVGLGSLVDKHHASRGSLGGVSYIAFLAPGMLAAIAMQIGAQESTYPVLGGIKWVKNYFAMLATPLRVVDVLAGQLLWIAMRITLTVTLFLVTMELFGAGHHWSVLLALPAAVLTGMAFAVPIVAYAATREGDAAFAALFRFVIVPMFLFSGTFFPVTQLPRALRIVAYVTPLWHGVDLCRSLALGDAGVVRSLGHAAYLLVFVVVGAWWARLTFTRRLAT
jgi:lipooligosaccharide transport system permease protein